MRTINAVACLAVLVTAVACNETELRDQTVETPAERTAKASVERIIGSWVIDETAQREEIARVSPSELEDFDQAFRMNLAPIRETFHPDGRYEVRSPLGGPFEDRWEIVSEDAKSLTIRSSGHSWVARRAAMGEETHERSTSVLTYTFSDPDHMSVTIRIPLFDEEKQVSYFFARDD
jgi:hypothetical protein